MPNTLSYLFTCGRVIRDQNTKLFTFIDAFDLIYIPQNTDFIYQSICIIARVDSLVNGDVRSEIRFTYPDGTDSVPIILTGNFVPGSILLAATFPVIKFTQLGRYFMKIKYQEEELERDNKFSFEVKKRS